MLLVLECLHTNPFAPAIAFVVPPWLTLLDLFLVVLPLKVRLNRVISDGP